MTPWVTVPLDVLLRTSVCQQEVLDRYVRASDLIAVVDVACARDDADAVAERNDCVLTRVQSLAGDVPERMTARGHPLYNTMFDMDGRYIVFGTVDPPACPGITWPEHHEGRPAFTPVLGPPVEGQTHMDIWHGPTSALRHWQPPSGDSVAVGLPVACSEEHRKHLYTWWPRPSTSWTGAIEAIERQVAGGAVGEGFPCRGSRAAARALAEERVQLHREQAAARAAADAARKDASGPQGAADR